MKKRVAIVCGGRSSEHEISCISAGGVLAAIDRTLYEPVLIGITKSGSWVLIPDSHSMEIQGKALPTVPEDAQPVVVDVAGF
jgi:D-alanine-D-alanine ligase